MDTDLKFLEWKAACVTAVRNEGLATDDLWDEGDPYELFDLAEEAFEQGVDPASFIAEVFEEDLARQAGDDAEREESFRQEVDFDDEGDSDPDGFDG